MAGQRIVGRVLRRTDLSGVIKRISHHKSHHCSFLSLLDFGLQFRILRYRVREEALGFGPGRMAGFRFCVPGKRIRVRLRGHHEISVPLLIISQTLTRGSVETLLGQGHLVVASYCLLVCYNFAVFYRRGFYWLLVCPFTAPYLAVSYLWGFCRPGFIAYLFWHANHRPTLRPPPPLKVFLQPNSYHQLY